MKKWHHQSWRWGWHKQQRREINSSFLLQWLSTTLKPNFLELEEERRKAELWHHFLSSTDASSFWWETLEPRKVPDQQSSYMTITYCFRQRMITAIFFPSFGHKIKSTLSSSFGDKVRGIHYYYQIAVPKSNTKKSQFSVLTNLEKIQWTHCNVIANICSMNPLLRSILQMLISLEIRKCSTNFPPFFWGPDNFETCLGIWHSWREGLKAPKLLPFRRESPHNMVLLGLRKATQS